MGGASVEIMDDVVMTRPESSRSGFTWGPASIVVVAVIIGIIVVIARRSNDSTPLSSLAGPTEAMADATEALVEDIGTIVNPVATEDSSAASAVVEEEATVEPKNSYLDRYFSSDFKADEPFLHGENDSFGTFQKAFFGKSEKAIYDKKPIASAFAYEGLSDYVKDHEVSEGLLQSMRHASVEDHQEPAIFAGNSEISDSEARMLASEAFQTVPNGPPDAVEAILREILAAKTECARLGLRLPEGPEEQTAAIVSWSRRAGPVGHIAKTILSQ